MTRKEKFPDTKTFHYFNANPHNRITDDCVTRAIYTALEISYTKVWDILDYTNVLYTSCVGYYWSRLSDADLSEAFKAGKKTVLK